MESKFKLGELVYLITDNEQSEYIVTQICFSLDGGVTYQLRKGTFDSWHYKSEISREKNISFALGLEN